MEGVYMERNSFLTKSWRQVIFGALKIMLCINLPIAIGTIVLPKVGNVVIGEILKFPSQIGFVQGACLNILISAMVFDVFFFWEGVRAGFKTWIPKMIKNLVVAAGAFFVSVAIIYILWDKAVVGFEFLSPKIGLQDALWLAIPIRLVIALYKVITGGLSAIHTVNDEEFESGKDKPRYRRHPSHIPPQIRSEEHRHQ